MPARMLANRLLPRGLELLKVGFKTKRKLFSLWLQKKSTSEVCPKCATLSKTIYDHRQVKVKDHPLADTPILLKIKKRRFWCKPCKKPFTEPINGIKKWGRCTERYRRYVFDLALRFANLYSAQKKAQCSSGFIYNNYFNELKKLRQKEISPWPSVIGIDEHFFGYNKQFHYREFVTVIVDFKRRKFKDVVLGRERGKLVSALSHIPGRENVKFVAMDLSEIYRSFIKDFFPNARRVADKFHVVRLLRPALRRYFNIIKNNTNGRLKKLLLANGSNLKSHIKSALHKGLTMHPELREIYLIKERLHKIYRMNNYKQADEFMTKMTDDLSSSKIPELQTLRKTLLSWRREILAYFEARITNALTEGLNNKAKQIKRRAYGFRSIENYKLKLVTAHI